MTDQAPAPLDLAAIRQRNARFRIVDVDHLLAALDAAQQRITALEEGLKEFACINGWRATYYDGSDTPYWTWTGDGHPAHLAQEMLGGQHTEGIGCGCETCRYFGGALEEGAG